MYLNHSVVHGMLLVMDILFRQLNANGNVIFANANEASQNNSSEAADLEIPEHSSCISRSVQLGDFTNPCLQNCRTLWMEEGWGKCSFI